MIGEPMYYLGFGTGIATILMSFLMATLEQRSNMPEAYSEPCQTSKMERFAKIFNGWKPFAEKVKGWRPSTIFAKISILDAWYGSEYIFAT